jgi:opacity protein-like surface antigen
MICRNIFFITLLIALATPLAAQEPWDPHLKLTAAVVADAVENKLGQNRAYGIALAGAYQLTIHGSAVVEAGYKVLPTTSVTEGSVTLDDKSEVFFVGAMYRHELWRNGVYLQGGMRASNTMTGRDIITKIGSDKTREKERGIRETKLGWCLGMGFRLTDLWSIELGYSPITFNNVAGTPIKATLLEIALCIHR